MTLDEFKTLDLERKCDAIWEWGFYVSRHKTEKVNKVLYSLNGFFAEMLISLEDNKVLDVTASEKPVNAEQIGYFIKNDNPFIKVNSKE
jgi:hypothetical protein